MSGLRRPLVTGLLLLMCALSEHCGESAPHTVAGGVDAPRGLRWMVEIMKHVEEPPLKPRAGGSSVAHRELRHKADRANQAQAFILDPKMKERLIRYLTGDLVFGSKCKKDAYRLYHHTRDCTIPAFFKRCARLLRRLAGNPLCTEG